MRELLLALVLCPVTVFAGPLTVMTSVVPLKTFVEAIGGRYVQVSAMAGPGYDPHTYEPSPQQIAALSTAALYVRTGLPFEDAWMRRLRSANPDMRVLDARSGLTLLEETSHDHGHGTKEPGYSHSDPHVWTSPRLVRHMAGTIRDALIELDSEHAEPFRRHHHRFVEALDRLDKDLHALLDPLPRRRFLVFHPAWGYFADAYGLEQVPIQREGKEPGARALVALIEQAKHEGIRAVFVQPQFDPRRARQVADAIGGDVIVADPLAPDYLDNLRRVAERLAEALR